MKRAGLLGGTFDPIHNGHMELAQNSYEQFSFDEIWMMVSPDPPHKKDHSISPFAHRFNMVQLAAQDRPYMITSDYEVRLPQPSYTVHTLRALKEDYPDTEFSFIIGEDSLDAIETWYHPEEVMVLTDLIVAVRNEGAHVRDISDQADYLRDKYGARIHILNSDYIDISSSDLRIKVMRGESIEGLVPSEVEKYIWTEHLYTT